MAVREGNGKVRKDQTDHYGRVKGDGGAKITDFDLSDTITPDEDSESGKIFFDVVALPAENVAGSEKYILSIVICTQAEYDAIVTKDENTLYIING